MNLWQQHRAHVAPTSMNKLRAAPSEAISMMLQVNQITLWKLKDRPVEIFGAANGASPPAADCRGAQDRLSACRSAVPEGNRSALLASPHHEVSNLATRSICIWLCGMIHEGNQVPMLY